MNLFIHAKLILSVLYVDLHICKILQKHFDVSVRNYVVHQLEDVCPKRLQD